MLTTGAIPPCAAAATSAVPTIGPVHEKETIAKASAIKKIPIKPPRSACESTLVPHELGKVISKAPRNETAKITSKAKKMRLNQTFVDNAFSESAPNTEVTTVPSSTYKTTIETPNRIAFRMPTALFLLCLVKKLTVIGIIGNTQGVSKAANPARKLRIKRVQRLFDFCFLSLMPVGPFWLFSVCSVWPFTSVFAVAF